MSTRVNSNQSTVGGLDSIRFLCAFWVVMDHVGGPPLLAGIDKSTLLGWVVNSAWNNAISGPAAVIVFFVISGFCIHYPQVDNKIPFLPSYFARRYIRILVPLIPAIIGGTLLHVELGLFTKTILWSLLAELIYYTIYPALLILRRRLASWLPLIGCAFVLAFTIAATDPTAGEYPSFGSGLNWLLGLPCWLIGCEVADRIRRDGDPRPVPMIWQWRAAVWLFSLVCSVLRFHSPIGYPWTLNIFAILVGVWITKEIRHFRRTPPSSSWERAGKWSYSLYLTHPLAKTVFLMAALPNLGIFLNWALEMAAILAFAYVFARVFEFPGHALARYASARLKAVAGTVPSGAVADASAGAASQPALRSSEMTNSLVVK